MSRTIFGSSAGGYRGTWDPNLRYKAGDIVTYRTATYAATATSTGTDPVSQVDALTGTPGNLSASDGGDYELVCYFRVSEPTRITGLCFYKSSLQTQVPHLLSLWDRDISTSAPLATTSSTTESGGFVGVVCAPLIADLLPGRRYAMSIKTGTGTDTGYALTASSSKPVASGPVIIEDYGFSSVVGSIATVTTGTNNYWVWPRYEVPSTSWGLVSRLDTAVAGAARSLSVAARPDPLACRPNDGTGTWPDFSNTGHFGTVIDYTTGMTATGWVPVQEANGSVLTTTRFLGKTGIGYGGQSDRLTFINCLFEGTQPNDNLVQIYCPTSVTFINCTFKPAGLSAPPGNNGTVSSASTSPGTTYAQSWQLIARMVPGQSTFIGCNIWGGAGLQGTGGPDVNHATVFRRCYIHDCADNDGSGGSLYHHDGIGPDSAGGSHDTLIEECTIASLGNTQGIALQGSSTYSRVTVRGCYLSGWGYALSIGNTTPWQGTRIRVEDNVFSAELVNVNGPLYGNYWNSGGGTNLWRRNRYQVKAGDADNGWTTADHGAYWWPTDNTGHPVDYTN